jgi:peptidoglycan/LPS O-acetylase OafA/YrhL
LIQSSLQKKSINFNILDSLRGLASLYVCIAHCRGNLWIGGEKYLHLHPFNTWNFTDWIIMFSMSLTKLSGEAVIFFFVLSGFSIAHSLRSQPSVKMFLLKRFIRLYPPYVLGFALALLSITLLKTNYDLYCSGKYDTNQFNMFKESLILFSPKTIISTLLYKPNLKTIIAPYWSLVYEVIFYGSAIIFVRKLKWYYIASIAFFLIGIGLEILMPQLDTENVFIRFTLQYNFYFMVGIYVYHNLDKLTNLKIMNNRYWVSILLSLYVLMILMESSIGEKLNISFVIAALCCVLMIIIFLKKNIHIIFLQKIGEFSYTLYVVHFSVITCILWFLFSVVKLTPPNLYNFLLWIPFVFVCVGVSYLMYLLVENPSKKILQRLRNR